MKPAIPTIFSNEKYSAMAPSQKGKYVEKKIDEILRLNTQGITLGDIGQNTPFSRPTIIKHLENLTSRRQGYKILRGNTYVYYPNSKAVYTTQPVEINIDSKRKYSGRIVENDFGQFVFLEERGNMQVAGGSWLIPREEWDTFKSFIKKIDTEVLKDGN